MLFGGAAWIIFISLINALVQNLAPDWVKARVLAIFILVYQGTYAWGPRLGALSRNDRAFELRWSMLESERSRPPYSLWSRDFLIPARI